MDQTTSNAVPRMVFLYIGLHAGHQYKSFSVADINRLSHANQLVLSPSPHWASLKMGEDCHYPSTLVVMVKTLETIRQSQQPRKKVWIGLPPADGTNDYKRQETCALNYLADAKVKLAPYWSQIEGFYLNAEDILWTVEGDVMKTAAVLYMRNVSNAIHDTYQKKTVFSTFYSLKENYAAMSIEKMGTVINKSNFFDIVLIQPSYYFSDKHEAPKSNMDGIYHSMVKQVVTYRDGVPVAPRSPDNRAVIGVQMELEDNIVADTNAMKRYRESEEKFRSLLGKYPFSYYAGARSGSDETWNKVSDLMNGFYGSR